MVVDLQFGGFAPWSFAEKEYDDQTVEIIVRRSSDLLNQINLRKDNGKGQTSLSPSCRTPAFGR